MTNTSLRSIVPLTLFCGFVMTGCDQPGTGIATTLVGMAVDNAETKSLGDELIGQHSAAADLKLGQTEDVWQQVDSRRAWRVYPAGIDLMDKQRYVIQVSNDRVVAVTKVKIDSGGIDLARKLLIAQKVDGKSPADCERVLEMGPPLVTARSKKSGALSQIYDARMLKGVTGPHYLRLRFDSNNRCTEASLIDVSASTKDEPIQRSARANERSRPPADRLAS